MKLFNEARKTLIALVAASGVAATALTDGKITGAEGIEIALAFLGALGVYQSRNVSSAVESDLEPNAPQI